MIMIIKSSCFTCIGEELKETGRALEIAKAEIIDLTLQTSVLKDSKGEPCLLACLWL